MSTVRVRFIALDFPVIPSLISLFTGHWANHIDITVDGDVYTAVPWYGVIKTRDENYSKFKRVEVREYIITEKEADDLKRSLDSRVGCGYDYGGVISFIMESRWNMKNRWYCSELVYSALYDAGCVERWEHPKMVSPGDIFHIYENAYGSEKGRGIK